MNDFCNNPSFTPKEPTEQINIFTQRRQIAIIWGIEDVQNLRPDLDDEQAWQVLQECEDRHDCEFGLNWSLIEYIADDLFSSPEVGPGLD